MYVYLYQDSFTNDLISGFIKDFLPGFKPQAEVFYHPQFSLETDFQSSSFLEMLEFILKNPGKSYCFYLKNPAFEPYQFGIINLCSDGSCSLGIAVPYNKEEYYINLLKRHYKQLMRPVKMPYETS